MTLLQKAFFTAESAECAEFFLKILCGLGALHG